MNIHSMTPRQIIVGLMRGDESTSKQGYTADNAVIAAAEVHRITDESELLILAAYSEGVADGLAQDPHRISALAGDGLNRHGL